MSLDSPRTDAALDRAPGTVTTRKVSFVDLTYEYELQRDDIDSAIGAVLARTDYILGEAVGRFEANFAQYCTTTEAIGVDSGFSALELMLRAWDIGPGDEVITAANTFYSTVRPIEVCGATPVLVDIDEVVNLDPQLLEQAITPRTKAVIAVHLYGHPANMSAIKAVAGEHDLHLFEDACQAHGATCDGVRAGALSDAAAFSFYPSKNLGAFGDAGIVVTSDREAADRMRAGRNLGSQVKYQHEPDGFNRRLDTVQAAVLDVKLRRLDEMNKSRAIIAAAYDRALADLSVTLPGHVDWAEPVHHLYVIETDDRDAVADHLNRHGIDSGIHYPTPIHLLPAFRWLGHEVGDFPVTERRAQRILSLPMHPAMSPSDVEYVAEVLRTAPGVTSP